MLKWTLCVSNIESYIGQTTIRAKAPRYGSFEKICKNVFADRKINLTDEASDFTFQLSGSILLVGIDLQFKLTPKKKPEECQELAGQSTVLRLSSSESSLQVPISLNIDCSCIAVSRKVWPHDPT